MSGDRWLEYLNRNFFSPEQSVQHKELERVEELVQNGQATQRDFEEFTIRFHAVAIADDSSREDYIEKELERLEEVERQAAMLQEEKIQHAEELMRENNSQTLS